MNNQKRIAKNTLMLYFRMLFIMAVSLYTSRIILNALGVVDYGLYNVVGSIITMFSFVNLSIATAAQRFLTYELGRGDYGRLNAVFSTSIFINLLICLILFVVGETIGYWIVANKLSIPLDKMDAALWVYQFSLFSCFISIMSSTYNAVLIAHERMASYAYISIVEVTLKLLAVWALIYLPFEKLKLYAVLVFVSQVIVQMIYVIYCRKKICEVKLKLKFSRGIFKEMLHFSMWNVTGSLSYILCTQGINVLLNIFMGPAVNAARGIAVQVQTAIQSFGNNFQQALNPQITKSYAANDFQYMHQLVISSSKYTFYLLFMLSLPILLDTNFVLTLWLKIVPEYTVDFVRMMLLISIIGCVSNPVMISAFATGKIRLFQIVDSLILLSLFPVSYVLLKLQYPPQSVFVSNLIIEALMFTARIIIVFPMIKLGISRYFRGAILPIVLVGVTSVIAPLYFSCSVDGGVSNLIVITVTTIFSVLISIYFLGISKSERGIVHQILLRVIKNKKM